MTFRLVFFNFVLWTDNIRECISFGKSCSLRPLFTIMLWTYHLVGCFSLVLSFYTAFLNWIYNCTSRFTVHGLLIFLWMVTIYALRIHHLLIELWQITSLNVFFWPTPSFIEVLLEYRWWIVIHWCFKLIEFNLFFNIKVFLFVFIIIFVFSIFNFITLVLMFNIIFNYSILRVVISDKHILIQILFLWHRVFFVLVTCSILWAQNSFKFLYSLILSFRFGNNSLLFWCSNSFLSLIF